MIASFFAVLSICGGLADAEPSSQVATSLPVRPKPKVNFSYPNDTMKADSNDRCFDDAEFCFLPGTSCSCCQKEGDQGVAYQLWDDLACVVYNISEGVPSIGPPGMCYTSTETDLCDKAGMECYCCQRPKGLIDEYSNEICFAVGSYDAKVVQTAVVQNQANCGSCWAFSTTEQLAARILKGDTSPNDTLSSWGPLLSAEVPVAFYDLGGCNGASTLSAANAYKARGVPELQCAQYFSGACGEHSADSKHGCLASKGYQEGTCYSDPRRSWHTWGDYAYEYIKGAKYISGTVAMMKDLVANGPLTTQFTVYESFYSYSGGVIDSVSGNSTGAHAVLIVGWGDDASTGKPYWNIMNSWGNTWGESGYFRFLRGSSLAGIEDYAMSMTISNGSTKTTSNDSAFLEEPEKPGGWTEIHVESDSVKLSLEALHQHWRSTKTDAKDVSLVKAFSQVIAGLHVELHLAVDSTNMTALARRLVQGSGLTTSGFEIVKLQEIPTNIILV